MSLLMEALKKAEQAKRKVTEAPAAAPSLPAAPPALALELTPTETAAPKSVPAHPAEIPPSAAAPALTAAAFTLMTARPVDTSPPVDVVSTPATNETTPPPAPAASQPPQPLPQIVRTPAKAELSLDIFTQPLRAAPPTRSLPPRRGLPMVWVAGGAALLAASAGGGYWYYNSMAKYLTQQSTLGMPQVAPAPAPEAVDTSAAPLVASAVVPPPLAVTSAAKTTPQAVAKINSARPPLRAPSAPAASAAVAVVPTPVPAVPDGASTTGSDVAASVPVPPPVPITISRDAEQNDLLVALQTAYRAYQRGDDSSAQTLYAGVLARDQHNRDALLGVAAIAVRQKDFVRAQEVYSELLTLDPKDSVAQAGFVSVTGSFDPLQQEARIKALLEQEPGAPHLLFTYASFLMQQQRWLEATRTLLPALSAQRDNADYAFNLAVSFDHLGQVEAAVKYYREALALASRQSTNFRVEDVRRRLKLMSPGGEGAAP